MAYAALVSLMHTIRSPTNDIEIYDYQLISLWSTLERLDDKRNRRIDMNVIYALDAEIREAAYKLEDMIQFYGLYRSLPPSDSLADMQIPPVNLDDLNQEIDLFIERVKKLEEDYVRVLDNPLPVVEEKDGDVSPIHDFGGNESTTVGLSDLIEEITNELLDLRSGPEIVSLVGMAGVGKTHVAREIARHPLIVRHFKFIAWVNVGSKRQMEDILVDVVAQIEGKPRNLYEGKSLNDLSWLLGKILEGGRYLVVLDDVWSADVGFFLRIVFPYVGHGSRLLVTTRLEEVGECNSDGIRQIRFLNKEESWNLLRQNVFGERYCSPQMEKVGRKIAEKCEGLPLLILTVARVLRGLEQTEEFWKMVADEKVSTFTDAYEEIYEVLYPSYEYLPQHLKACFLYMAVFPQSCEIILPKLLNLWIAEDFFKDEVYYTEEIRKSTYNIDLYSLLETHAMECLEKLVSHSVVIICKHSSRFTIKSCKLHSAFWHLCTREARKIKLFHVLKRSVHASPDYIESQRRLSVQNNILFGIKEVYDSMAATLTARSLLCTGPDHEYQVPICLNLVLLKVLDAAAIRYYEFPTEVLKLVRLKYLALTHHGKFPSSISNLQELQCLIVRQHHIIRFVRDVDSVCLPKEMGDEIRDLPEVRSIKLLGDSTCLAKEIWEKICDIQQVWSFEVLSNPACLEKETWMELWRIASGEDSMQRRSMMWHMQRTWSIKLLRDSAGFPKEILGQLWEKIWDMQQEWSTKLQRESLGLLKEIWEEMWEIQQVRSSKMLCDSTYLPKEIWEMQQLRHLRIIGRNLPDPSYGTKLPCLLTLHVNAHSCTYSVFKSLPYLKKLGIKIELRPDAAETINCFKHIGVLKRLESLKCVVVNPQPVVAPADQLSNFPSCLKKLSLSGCGCGLECMSAIGSLPELEVLKLRCAAFQGPEWETKVDEFPSLKYLLLEEIDLERWTIAENGCLPRLQRLIIRHCYRLKELPRPRALKMIEVVDCSPSVVASAEQAPSSVEVVITSSWKLRR